MTDLAVALPIAANPKATPRTRSGTPETDRHAGPAFADRLSMHLDGDSRVTRRERRGDGAVDAPTERPDPVASTGGTSAVHDASNDDTTDFDGPGAVTDRSETIDEPDTDTPAEADVDPGAESSDAPVGDSGSPLGVVAPMPRPIEPIMTTVAAGSVETELDDPSPAAPSAPAGAPLPAGPPIEPVAQPINAPTPIPINGPSQTGPTVSEPSATLTPTGPEANAAAIQPSTETSPGPVHQAPLHQVPQGSTQPTVVPADPGIATVDADGTTPAGAAPAPSVSIEDGPLATPTGGPSSSAPVRALPDVVLDDSDSTGSTPGNGSKPIQGQPAPASTSEPADTIVATGTTTTAAATAPLGSTATTATTATTGSAGMPGAAATPDPSGSPDQTAAASLATSEPAATPPATADTRPLRVSQDARINNAGGSLGEASTPVTLTAPDSLVISTGPSEPVRALAPALAPELAAMRGTNGRRTLDIRLDPPHLGSIELEIHSRGNTVMVVARAETAEAAAAILRQRTELEQTLLDLGMDLAGFDVSTSHGDPDQHDDGESQTSSTNRTGERDDSGEPLPVPPAPQGSVFL